MSSIEPETVRKEPLMQVRGLSKEYIQRRSFTHEKFRIRALDNVNLTIERGKTLGMAGESGSGKSTLVRCLALIEAPSSGEIWFEGERLSGRKKRELSLLRRQIPIIFQDASTALNPRMRAADIISEPLVIQREGAKHERRKRAAELMEQVGLPTASLGKLPLEFSGGQRQRLAIARALALKPKLLILDEALSHLDLVNQDMMLDLLSCLRKTHGLTYIHVSHDLQMLAGIADEIAILCEGRIVECGLATQIFEHPEHAYTRDLLEAIPALTTASTARFAGGLR